MTTVNASGSSSRVDQEAVERVDPVAKDAAADHRFTVTLNDSGIVRNLSLVALLLVVLGLFGQWSLGRPDYPGRDLLAGLTDPGGEANLAACFSAGLLVCAAALFAVIACAKRQDVYGRVWRGLAWVFSYLAVDEYAMLHERTVVFIKHALGESATSGVLHHAWVLPYAIFCVAVFATTIRFLLHLPVRTRNLILAAGALYVGGALGFEMLEGPLAASSGVDNNTIRSLIVVEEILEMSGIILLISTLFGYIRHNIPAAHLEFSLKSVDV